MFYFVDDAVGNSAQDFVGDFCPVGCHKIIGCDGTESDEFVICSCVTHNAYGFNTWEDCEELAHFICVTALIHFITKNCIGFLKNTNLFGCNFTDYTHTESRTRERLTPYEVVRKSKLLTYYSYLILEKVFKRFNYTCKVNIFRDTNLVMMCFDFCGIAFTAFDTVGINCTLCKVTLAVAFTDFVPEHLIKFCADDVALFFGFFNTFKLCKELFLTINADKVHIKKLCKGLLYKVALVFSHKSLINENAGKLFTDCLTEKCCGNG